MAQAKGLHFLAGVLIHHLVPPFLASLRNLLKRKLLEPHSKPTGPASARRKEETHQGGTEPHSIYVHSEKPNEDTVEGLEKQRVQKASSPQR